MQVSGGYCPPLADAEVEPTLEDTTPRHHNVYLQHCAEVKCKSVMAAFRHVANGRQNLHLKTRHHEGGSAEGEEVNDCYC